MASVTFQIEPGFKKEAEELLDNLGLNLNSAFMMFLNQLNDCSLEALEEVRRMEEDPSIGKSYANAREMLEDILSDGDHEI